jgi:hypothetical protein
MHQRFCAANHNGSGLIVFEAVGDTRRTCMIVVSGHVRRGLQSGCRRTLSVQNRMVRSINCQPVRPLVAVEGLKRTLSIKRNRCGIILDHRRSQIVIGRQTVCERCKSLGIALLFLMDQLFGS